MRRLLFALVCVVGLVAPAGAATDVTFLQATSSTADTNSYTFSAQNLGTEAADRCIVVEVAARRAAATVTTISTVTVGGSSAAVLRQLSVEESSTATVVGIAAVLLPTGTSGDVVVTFSGSMVRARIALSTLTGADDCTVAADSDESELNDPSVALDVPDDGSAVAICGYNTGSGSATWTGLTETHDAVVESLFTVTGASADFATQQTGLTITCDLVAGGSVEAGVFVSWGPDTGGGGTAPARMIGGRGRVF